MEMGMGRGWERKGLGLGLIDRMGWYGWGMPDTSWHVSYESFRVCITVGKIDI